MKPEDPPRFPIDRFARRQTWKPRGTGPTGRPLCYSGCDREVMPPKRTRCSDACGAAWALRSNPAMIRRRVEERDHGICALCGVDTAKHARMVRETESLWRWLARREAEERLTRGEKLYERPTDLWRGEIYEWTNEQVAEQLREHGFDHHGGGHVWEADHIVPVVEGGGGCTPDGYRTLCLPCHRSETAKLATRRARARATNHVQQLTLA